MSGSTVIRRLALSAAMLLSVVAVGTMGYWMLEGYSWFDALYATVTTISTVGGGEVRPYHTVGKIWTMIVVSIGFLAFTDVIVTLVGYLIEGHLGQAVIRRRMRRRIANMRNHFILCGFGRIGREIATEFAAEGVPFVVVDINESSLAAATAQGYTVMHGNASQLETLKSAGVALARGLVTAVDNDADNVYVTLTARVLRPDLFIVARSNTADAEPKLRLAGANRVASPYVIGGKRLASLATRPTAVDFIDTVLSAKNAQLMLEDFKIPSGSPWIGRSIGGLASLGEDALILALKRGDTMHFRPAPETTLALGDELVFAGPADQVRAIEARLTPGT